MNSADVRQLSQRFQQLIDARSNLEPAWLALADHFLPTRYTSINNDNSNKNPLLNDKIVDATGIHAMRTLAAGLQGGMTSPARPWFRLGLEDDQLEGSRAVRSFLDAVANRMRNILHRSNFYNSIHTLYSDLGTFGTGFLFEFADFKDGIRFITVPAGQYVIDVSSKDRVDTLYRRISMTTRQVVQEFGYEKCPQILQSAFDSRSRDTTDDHWNIIHAVYPRSDRKLDSGLQEHMPFASVYWLEFGSSGTGGGTGGYGRSSSYGGKPHILREGGFEDFPGFGPRWDTIAGSAYGRSPAMDCLADCKMLQQMGITTLKAIHKAVDPPLSVSASLKSVGIDLTPSGLNYVEALPGQAPQAATPILQVRPEIQAARIMTQDVQNQIKQGLYNDLFKMLLGSDRRQITASEVAAREEEKLILIGPVLERLHDELFIPLINRTFSIMTRFDLLPEVPEELRGTEIKVEFVSLLAQAQKLVSTGAVNQLMQFTLSNAGAFPEILDAIDTDKVMDGYGEYLGVEVDMLRSQDERDAIRAQRAAQQQQAQQMAMLQQGAGIAKDAGPALAAMGGK